MTAVAVDFDLPLTMACPAQMFAVRTDAGHAYFPDRAFAFLAGGN